MHLFISIFIKDIILLLSPRLTTHKQSDIKHSKHARRPSSPAFNCSRWRTWDTLPSFILILPWRFLYGANWFASEINLTLLNIGGTQGATLQARGCRSGFSPAEAAELRLSDWGILPEWRKWGTEKHQTEEITELCPASRQSPTPTPTGYRLLYLQVNKI